MRDEYGIVSSGDAESVLKRKSEEWDAIRDSHVATIQELSSQCEKLRARLRTKLSHPEGSCRDQRDNELCADCELIGGSGPMPISSSQDQDSVDHPRVSESSSAPPAAGDKPANKHSEPTPDYKAQRDRLLLPLAKIEDWAKRMRHLVPSHGTHAEEIINLCEAIEKCASEARGEDGE